MALLKSLFMSAKNRDYDPMSEDGYDSKIPLHNDEAFQHGLQFNAKFIGSLEVPKPTSRVEIVSAMRRIRYEFKAKAVKKRKVTLSISVDGIKVCLSKKTKKELYIDENDIVIMQHPVYRVFYVSHDSQDLKIFSYIARDHINNSFRCNVFKAYKKSSNQENDRLHNEAMRIVRTIGQAFEVCHKIALQQRHPTSSNSTSSPTKISTISIENEPTPKQISPEHLDSKDKGERYLQSVDIPSVKSLSDPFQSLTVPEESKPINIFPTHSSSEFTLKHQMQFMQEQLQQMQNESELAFNQIKLIKEQLNIEVAARIDAQNKNTQLLQRNRELLTHIQQLLLYTNDLEIKLAKPNQIDSFKLLPTRPKDLLFYPSLSNQHGLSSDSPDSGKGKEISSESISDPYTLTLTDHQQIPNSTKTFSIHDDLTTQSISVHDSSQHTRVYESSSPSLVSSTSSCTSSTSMKKHSKSDEKYLYQHMKSNGSSSFTNSAFSQSPLRTVAKEFDPLMK
ncbi:unnamed protein product [Adineta ricciae]|uniref:PID domain-containing protein n=1 Tax=Adineta ricciae TaxID=249248 RepID=A0A815T438_ADIRI|nr:unnamed protein product [Adineta ricciae]